GIRGGAWRDAGVADRAMPERLTEAEPVEREAAARLATQRHPAVPRGAGDAEAVAAVPRRRQLDALLARFGVPRHQPGGSRGVEPGLERMAGGEPHLEAAAQVRGEARERRSVPGQPELDRGERR